MPWKFLNLELIGIKENPSTTDDDLALKNLDDMIRFSNGRYEVRWSWKSEIPELPQNFELSLGRLKSMSKGLQQNLNLFKQYNEYIKEYLKKT